MLGGGVADGLTEAQGPVPAQMPGPLGPQSLGAGTGLSSWPQFPQWETRLVESWNARFWDSREGLALPFQGKV